MGRGLFRKKKLTAREKSLMRVKEGLESMLEDYPKLNEKAVKRHKYAGLAQEFSTEQASQKHRMNWRISQAAIPNEQSPKIELFARPMGESRAAPVIPAGREEARGWLEPDKIKKMRYDKQAGKYMQEQREALRVGKKATEHGVMPRSEEIVERMKKSRQGARGAGMARLASKEKSVLQIARAIAGGKKGVVKGIIKAFGGYR